MQTLLGNFVYNTETGESFLPDGRIMDGGFNHTAKHLFSETLPGTFGQSMVFSHLLQRISRRYETRLDTSSGIPRFVVDIYDLDGQVVVATEDFAQHVINAMKAYTDGQGAFTRYWDEQYQRVEHLPQP